MYNPNAGPGPGHFQRGGGATSPYRQGDAADVVSDVMVMDDGIMLDDGDGYGDGYGPGDGYGGHSMDNAQHHPSHYHHYHHQQQHDRYPQEYDLTGGYHHHDPHHQHHYNDHQHHYDQYHHDDPHEQHYDQQQPPAQQQQQHDPGPPPHHEDDHEPQQQDGLSDHSAATTVEQSHSNSLLDDPVMRAGGAANMLRGSPLDTNTTTSSSQHNNNNNTSAPPVMDSSCNSLTMDGEASTSGATATLAEAAATAGPTYLFQVLEAALPKAAEAVKPLTTAEQAQRRDAVDHAWECVRQYLWSHPTETERRAAATVRGGQANATPLHFACKLPHPPVEIIEALVEAAPEVSSWTDSHGWLPLHHACANGASPAVMQFLIRAHPPSKVQQDKQGRTPLHFYATTRQDNNESDNPDITVQDMATNAQLLTDTGAAQLQDRNGMLPMHYACAYGSHPAVLNVIAQEYPDSLTARENHGRTPMHLAMVNAHRDASPTTISFLLEYPAAKATINVRDQDGYLPLHLMSLGLKGYQNKRQAPEDETSKRHNVGESLSLYLEAEPKPVADFLTAIQDLPEWLQDTAVVSKHVRNVLNWKIVKRFPTSILMLDGYLLIIVIVCFAVTTKNHIDLRFDPANSTNTTQAALTILLVGSVYFICRELVQVFSLLSIGSLSNWWKDSSNWLDLGVFVLVTYYAVLMATGAVVISNQAFRSGVAFTQGLLWVAIILFLKKTLVDFAVFVGGVVYVVQRLAAFLLAVGVILLCFAQMFYFVYVDTAICTVQTAEECRFPHCSFWESLIKVYTMMMGEIGDVRRYSTDLTAEILYVFYAFLVVILLSNVLIAIVTDSYEIIQNDRAAIVFWSNRLDFVAEMEAISFAVKRRLPCLRTKNYNMRSNRKLSVNQLNVSTASLGDAQREGAVDLFDMEISTKDYFRMGWKQVMMLFDHELYEDIDMIETVAYNIFRIFCLFVVIPLWILLGVITAGWLWPPQAREWLFAQRDPVISRADIERAKLKQLQAIQEQVQEIRGELQTQMATDREELLRMRDQVEKIQTEVLADLLQLKELMRSLLGE